MLTRRQFLYLSSMFLIGCSHVRLSNLFTEKIEGGNLYFCNLSESLNQKNLEKITIGVRNNFERIGITTKNNDLIKCSNYPSLGSLDVLMLLTDNGFGAGFDGMFGIKNSRENDSLYSDIRGEFKLPYDELTTECNLGVACVAPTLNKLREANIPANYLTDSQKIKYIIDLCTHEIAHGYGASHIKGNILKAPSLIKYFMYAAHINNSCFHEENILKMKKFIKNVKNSPLTKDEIITLRNKSLKEYILVS
jgi:hypothetical protein